MNYLVPQAKPKNPFRGFSFHSDTAVYCLRLPSCYE
jgi:hypothetical protein